MLSAGLSGLPGVWLGPASGLGSAVAGERAGSNTLTAIEAKAWLTRIHQAASQHSYRGAVVVSAGGLVHGMRVLHVCEGPHQLERMEPLEGQARHVLRDNKQQYTVWPQRRMALLEQRGAVTDFPALLQPQSAGFSDWYVVKLGHVERVAGFEAQVLQMQPRDALRFGYRLWSDRRTGLLLRAEVLSAAGEVLETTSFTELHLQATQGAAAKAAAREVRHAIRDLAAYRVVRPQVKPARLEDEGWGLRVDVPGFREVSCVKRVAEPASADEAAAGQGPLLQSVWSDGLTTVSVFLEPYEAKRHPRELQAAMGATHTLMRRHGDWWLTLMGDVPAPTLKQFAAGLTRAVGGPAQARAGSAQTFSAPVGAGPVEARPVERSQPEVTK
jgi:sigma-E factor negative regulatory protein RseB